MKKQKLLLSAILLGGTVLSGMAMATNEDKDDIVNFAINPDTVEIYMKSNITTGSISGIDCTGPCAADLSNATTIHWAYHGDVYAANVNGIGVQKSPVVKIGTVDGAPAFPASFMALGNPAFAGDPTQVAAAFGTETLPWTCTDCTLKISGSEFHRIANMPLTGRAFLGLGAVPNKEGLLAMRMGGCAGVQETSGMGKYANMMGTICLNGTIGFNPDFTGVGTSNCVMVLQKGPYSPTVR